MPLILIDFFALGSIDRLNMNQVAGLPYKVPAASDAVLDDNDPFEVDSEVMCQFLDRPIDTDLYKGSKEV